MAEQKWVVSSIIGVIVLLSVGSYFFYSSDYKFLLHSMPDKDIFVLNYNTDDKIEIVTRSSVCDYALFRITKDDLTVKCGYRVAVTAKWYLEYFKTYGADEWVRLDRKRSGITLGISQEPDGYTITKKTPYYATKSKTGTAGVLTETFFVKKDLLKSSLSFDTAYDSREWRVVWKAVPNTEIVEEGLDYYKTDKNIQVYFNDAIFDRRIDNEAFYKPQPGSFKIDPLIQFGNPASGTKLGGFYSGYCENCVNERNVSFPASSSAFSATYESGWLFQQDIIRQIDNVTFGCEDPVGAGFCELSVRNGTEIIPVNDSTTITRCLINSSNCTGRVADGSGYSFIPGPINEFNAVLINDTDTFFLMVNSTPTGDSIDNNWTGYNYTINMSGGSMELMVVFR